MAVVKKKCRRKIYPISPRSKKFFREGEGSDWKEGRRAAMEEREGAKPKARGGVAARAKESKEDHR